jgi:hypothetical protein
MARYTLSLSRADGGLAITVAGDCVGECLGELALAHMHHLGDNAEGCTELVLDFISQLHSNTVSYQSLELAALEQALARFENDEKYENDFLQAMIDAASGMQHNRAAANGARQ